MIHVKALTKRYGTLVAVDDLSSGVGAGELFALLGPNGAGKSTTLACVLGFERPDAGRAIIDGIDVARARDAARQRVAYIPEQVSLYDAFSALENVALFASLSGHRLSRSQLTDLLGRAGLQREAHNRPTSTYSKGMRPTWTP